MTNLITGIERDIVLSSLYEKNTQVILNCESEKKPILFSQNEYTIPTQNLIFFSSNIAQSKSNSLAKIIQSNVNNLEEYTICFFYQGIALFFKSFLQKCENGFAFVIPPTLFKKDEQKTEKNNSVFAKIFYTGQKKKGNFLTCYSDDNFEIFEPKVWLSFPKKIFKKAAKLLVKVAKIEHPAENDTLLKDFPSSKKLLYLPEGKIADRNYFPYEASYSKADYLDSDFVNDALNQNKELYIPFAESFDQEPYAICSIIPESVVLSPLDIEDSLHLLVVCKFLAEGQRVDLDKTIAQSSPLKLLYVNDSMLILGSDSGDFPLQKGYEYPVSIVVPLKIGKREIFVTCFVSRVFEHSNGKTCAICKFSGIAEEDKRFLFEKIYSKKYR